MDTLILLGSRSDKGLTEHGLSLLRQFEISYELRIASAHRSPEHVHRLVSDFEQDKGQVFICVAGKSAHLGGVVASLTVKPVLCVPVYNPETAGFDALLSMGQMPQGVPVATLGFGKHGFTNACLLASQMLALKNPELASKLMNFKKEQTQQVLQDDAHHREAFP